MRCQSLKYNANERTSKTRLLFAIIALRFYVGLFYYDNIYSIMPETYISMDELLDRMNRHPDVKNASKAQQMLNALGRKQDKTKKPRVHITKSKNKQKYLLVV